VIHWAKDHHCCVVAGIPRQSYYMLHKRQPVDPKDDQKAGAA